MRAPDLYEQVKQLEQDWLKSNVQTLIVDSISSSLVRAQKSTDAQDQSSERREAGEKFLTVLKDAWEDHQLGMGMVTDVLMYMVSSLHSTVLLQCSKFLRRTVWWQAVLTHPSMLPAWLYSEIISCELASVQAPL